jgi:DNA-directed RNA polymerase subunit RPC12/RpoP
MPYDPYLDEEEEPEGKGGDGEGKSRRFREFECSDCDAYNPYDDGFGDGDEIRCHYCGQEFRVQVSEEGRLRLRPT